MGKKESWFSAVKKILSNHSEKKDKKQDKSKKNLFQKEESVDAFSIFEQSLLDVSAEPPPIEDDVHRTEENEPSWLMYSDTAEPEMSEEIAAIMIQSAFRGYTARKTLRGLKALMRLRALVEGHSVKQQVASALKSMQTLARVQSEIRARRIRMSEENRALQQQLCNKREKELEKSKNHVDDDWNHSTRSKAHIEAKLLNKQEAAIRRERALAYAHSHQQTWRNSPKTAATTVMDPNNPHWGWSWLERWMEARPWEPRSTANHPGHISSTSVATRAPMVDVIQIYACRDENSPAKSSPRTSTSQKSNQRHRHQSPSTPKALSSPSSRKKTNLANAGVGSWGRDDDTRSTASVNPKLTRRHSIAESSLRDELSLASLPSVSSHASPSKPMTARSRSAGSSAAERKGTMEKGSANKRLSFTTSPAKPRRLSSPPIVSTSQVL